MIETWGTHSTIIRAIFILGLGEPQIPPLRFVGWNDLLGWAARPITTPVEMMRGRLDAAIEAMLFLVRHLESGSDSNVEE